MVLGPYKEKTYTHTYTQTKNGKKLQNTILRITCILFFEKYFQDKLK